MPQSLHLIHAGKKARGDSRRQKPPITLAEVRRGMKLPFKPEHITQAELELALEHLNAK